MDIYILRIKEVRNTKRLTQKQLAERVGISRSFLGEIENGKWDIRLGLLIKISAALEVNYSELIKYK